MISIDQALSLVLEHAALKTAARAAVADALDLVLAEDVTSDVDCPPHDKAMVDGYAVVAADLASGSAELAVLEEVTAGELPAKIVTPGSATRIMTGAPIPEGADAVVMIERTEFSGAGDGSPPVVRIRDVQVRADQHIMSAGSSVRRGEVVLTRGSRIRPIEVGLLSEVGRAHVSAYVRPRVSVLATGDELVAPDIVPGAGQIRNSNGPMIAALVTRAGATPVELGIARDEEQQLRQLIARGLEEDVLVLSGGVSAGVLDLVPSALEQLGVRQVFHKVRIKPGKPLWFGILAGGPRPRLVFGLPGNPVSSLVCFELFVRPALAQLAGSYQPGDRRRWAELAGGHEHLGDRPTYFPAVFRQDEGRAMVEPIDWKGSADLRSLTGANCLAVFPARDRAFTAGETVDIVMLK